MHPRRTALAHDHLFQIGGAEQVLRQMVLLYPDAPLYTLICKRENFNFLKDTDIRTSYLQSMPGGIRFFKWYLGLMTQAWEAFDFSGYDLIISSASAFAKGLTVPAGSVHISYCHTPTRYLWSDTDEYIESLHLPSVARLALERLLDNLRTWDRGAAQRPDHLLANSKFIAQRILKYYGRTSTVIYPPVDVRDIRPVDSVDSYYLIVSRLRPYKRVDLVIEAFNQLRMPLVIIGGGEELASLKKKAKRNISFLGEVSDAVRNKYLARCKAFIHPQEEDFGISAVEAMAAGRPVIAYRAGGALETVSDGVSGAFFDEQSWESLAYAVLQFDERRFDSKRIRQHAEQFGTSVFAQRIRDFIQAVPSKV